MQSSFAFPDDPILPKGAYFDLLKKGFYSVQKMPLILTDI